MDRYDCAERIINTLEDNGYKAYIVGGAVRDMLIGKEPMDYDIATSASPLQVKKLFSKVINIGERYGTVTVMLEGFPFEITRFRTEGDYEDSRHPTYVLRADNIEEDLSRRDFTINAIAYNKKEGYIDPFDGKKDIDAKIIRAVGDPDKRFYEDALRILRAYRFASRLGFCIEENTREAACDKAYLLRNISTERVTMEISQILCGDCPSLLEDILNTNALSEFLPKTNGLELLDHITNSIQIRFTALCYICGVDAGQTAGKMRFSNSFCKEVGFIQKVLLCDNFTSVAIKKLLRHSSYELMEMALISREDIKSVSVLREMNILKRIKIKNEPYKISHVKVSGDDLMRHGYKGKEISDKLEELLEKVIAEPDINEKEKLLELCR